MDGTGNGRLTGLVNGGTKRLLIRTGWYEAASHPNPKKVPSRTSHVFHWISHLTQALFHHESTQREDRKATHRTWFDMMNKFDEELRLALAEKDDERAYASRLVSKLRTEKAQESSKLHEAIAVRENALVESQRLQKNSVN